MRQYALLTTRYANQSQGINTRLSCSLPVGFFTFFFFFSFVARMMKPRLYLMFSRLNIHTGPQIERITLWSLFLLHLPGGNVMDRRRLVILMSQPLTPLVTPTSLSFGGACLLTGPAVFRRARRESRTTAIWRGIITSFVHSEMWLSVWLCVHLCYTPPKASVTSKQIEAKIEKISCAVKISFYFC